MVSYIGPGLLQPISIIPTQIFFYTLISCFLYLQYPYNSQWFFFKKMDLLRQLLQIFSLGENKLIFQSKARQQKKLGSVGWQSENNIFSFLGTVFLTKYFAQQTQKKNLQFITHYNNNKYFLVLVIFKKLLCFIYYFQKSENNRLQKKARWPKFFNIMLLFLLKIGLVQSADQQINLVSPQVFSLFCISTIVNLFVVLLINLYKITYY